MSFDTLTMGYQLAIQRDIKALDQKINAVEEKLTHKMESPEGRLIHKTGVMIAAAATIITGVLGFLIGMHH